MILFFKSLLKSKVKKKKLNCILSILSRKRIFLFLIFIIFRYESLKDYKDVNDFFENTIITIKNANILLEKISQALKKLLDKKLLDEKEKELIYLKKNPELDAKNDEIKKINSIITGNISKNKTFKIYNLEKERLIKELTEENKNLKLRLDNVVFHYFPFIIPK